MTKSMLCSHKTQRLYLIVMCWVTLHMEEEQTLTLRYFLFFPERKQFFKEKLYLGSVSAKQMTKATEQIKAIQKAYAGNVTDDVLDDLISKKNNDWNPNINTKADMDEWLNENNIDILDVKTDGISSRPKRCPWLLTQTTMYLMEKVHQTMLTTLWLDQIMF